MKLTPDQFNALPESIKKRNPDLFLGAVARTESKQNVARPLDRSGQARNKSKVRICVSFVRFGGRSLDSDNLAGAFKHGRDFIARMLGVDDADPRLRWQYGQCETHGETGTLVVIECV